jgi:hypothetical protein
MMQSAHNNKAPPTIRVARSCSELQTSRKVEGSGFGLFLMAQLQHFLANFLVDRQVILPRRTKRIEHARR